MAKGRSLVVTIGDYQPDDFVDLLDKASLNAFITLVTDKKDFAELDENIAELAKEEDAGLMVMVIGDNYDYLNDVFEKLVPTLDVLDPSVFLMTDGGKENTEFFEAAISEALSLDVWNKLYEKDKVNLVLCNNSEEEIDLKNVVSNIAELLSDSEEEEKAEETTEDSSDDKTEDTEESGEDSGTEETEEPSEEQETESKDEEDGEPCDNGHFGNYDKKNTSCRECNQRKKCRKLTYAKEKGEDTKSKKSSSKKSTEPKDKKEPSPEKETKKKTTTAEGRDDKEVDHIKEKIEDTKKRIEDARKKSPKDRVIKMKHSVDDKEEPVEVKVLALLDAMDNLLDIISK